MGFLYTPRWQDFADLLQKDPDQWYALMEDRERQLEAYLNFGEETYTPEITSTGSAPTIGSTGYEFGAFSLVGRMCMWHGEIAFGGAGVTAGTGSYIIPLPISARLYVQAGNNVWRTVGTGSFEDASGSVRYDGHLQVNAGLFGGKLAIFSIDGLVGFNWAAGSPVTVAAGDNFRWFGQYMIDED